MLHSEKAPYFFTLAIAILGWCISRAVDRITDGPALAYAMEQKEVNREQDLTVRIENTTASTVYRNLEFHLSNLEGEGARFTSVDIEYPPPIWPDAMDRKTPVLSVALANYQVPELQPGASVLLRARHTGNGYPVLRFHTNDNAVRLVTGWKYAVARNEITILFSLIALWCLFILIYLVLLSRKPPTPAPL
jgi:hypothetical protein